MTRMRNAKKLTDQLHADLRSLEAVLKDLSALQHLIRDATLRTRSNPGYVEDQHKDILARLERVYQRTQADLRRLRDRLTEELPPMLERAARNHTAAALPQSVATLTEQVRHLSNALDQHHQRIQTLEHRLLMSVEVLQTQEVSR